MASTEGPVCCVPQMGIRPELLSPVNLNRSISNDRLSVSDNSAFAHYQRRSATPTKPRKGSALNGLEKSRSSATLIFNNSSTESDLSAKKPIKMESFHELHIDIPITEFLISEPNSSTITPSPRPDAIPEAEFQTLKQRQFLKPLPFIEYISPATSSSTSPPKKEEPQKSTHFKEILNLFQNAANVRQTQKRPQPSRKPLRSRFDSQSFDESSERSGSDSSLNRHLQFKMPRSTTVATASKTQTRTLITEHFSSEEEDRGIVKDIIFQNNQKRIPIERKNPPMLKNTSSLLSLDVNEPPKLLNKLGNSLTVSMYSPQPNKMLHSPVGSVRSHVSDGLFHQMATSHSSTLAYVAESSPKLLREFSPLASVGQEIFEHASLSNIVFKSTTPVFIKDKIALFDAAFIASNYIEYPVTVLISPAGQYAPLLGRHAERSGFGPPSLGEFEELEVEMRHFLQESGYEQKPMSTLRIVLMAPMNVCSLQSLAAHYLSKCLQSDNIEQLSNNFKEFILSYANPDGKNLLQTIDQLPRLMLLKDAIDECNDDQLSVLNFTDDSSQQSTQTVGICKFALRALCTLLNRKLQGVLPEIPERTKFSAPLRKCAQILNMDRTSSLSEAKQLLEFAFFANNHNFESEYEAKLWLDEKRAQFVNQLVRWLIQRDAQITSPKQQIYLQFLLSSTPRALFKTCHQLRRK